MYFVQLPKFDLAEEECKELIECWIYIIKSMETLERLPFTDRHLVFTKLRREAGYASMDKEERMVYDQSLKALRDQVNQLATAKKEGIDEGRAEGRTELQLFSAKSMLADGMPPELVAKYSDLTIDVVLKLKGEA